MRMDRLTPYRLASFIENLITVLSGPELSAIDPAVRAALVAELAPLPPAIRSEQKNVEELTGQLRGAFASRNDIMAVTTEGGIRVRKILAAVDAPAEQWELCGFDKPGPRRREYVARIPQDLKVSGYFQGSIRGKFTGNNKSGSVLYEVFRRSAEDDPWALRMAVKETSFVDEDVTFDGSYWYMVRARSSKNVSEFSDMVRVDPR